MHSLSMIKSPFNIWEYQILNLFILYLFYDLILLCTTFAIWSSSKYQKFQCKIFPLIWCKYCTPLKIKWQISSKNYLFQESIVIKYFFYHHHFLFHHLLNHYLVHIFYLLNITLSVYQYLIMSVWWSRSSNWSDFTRAKWLCMISQI